jgi:hypothetical protein
LGPDSLPDLGLGSPLLDVGFGSSWVGDSCSHFGLGLGLGCMVSCLVGSYIFWLCFS